MPRPSVSDVYHLIYTGDIINDIIALANTKGGFIHIGKCDGEYTSVDDIQSLKEKIKSDIEENVYPTGQLCYEIVTERDKKRPEVKIIKIIIASCSQILYRYDADGAPISFYRIKGNTITADRKEVYNKTRTCTDESLFKCHNHHHPYMYQLIPNEFLTFNGAKEFCATHSHPSQWARLRDHDDHPLGDDEFATNLGRLLSDQCTSQIEIIDVDHHTNKANIFLCKGSYITQIFSANEHLNSILADSPAHKFPTHALTTLIAQMVIYRDYTRDTPIKIYVTEGKVSATFATVYNDPELIEDYCLGLTSAPHPELIDALSLLGLNLLEYEHFGLLNGYYYRYDIAPEYSASPRALSITLPSISNTEVYKSESSLSSRENKVLSYLRNNHTCTRATLEKELSIPQPSVTRILNKLILRGYIEKMGSGRSTKYSAKQF